MTTLQLSSLQGMQRLRVKCILVLDILTATEQLREQVFKFKSWNLDRLWCVCIQLMRTTLSFSLSLFILVSCISEGEIFFPGAPPYYLMRGLFVPALPAPSLFTFFSHVFFFLAYAPRACHSCFCTSVTSVWTSIHSFPIRYKLIFTCLTCKEGALLLSGLLARSAVAKCNLTARSIWSKMKIPDG